MSEILKELVLRPNLDNRGTLPELGDCLNECPDILCVGDTPVKDFQDALAKEECYLAGSEFKYVRGHINYAYVRIKNNSENNFSNILAELFYCDVKHVSSVSNWKRIPVENRELSLSGNAFDDIGPGAIGVVTAPFMLPHDLDVDKELCLIARIWSGSEEFNNPMPNKLCPTYINNLTAEHLWWGQKNFCVYNKHEYPFSFASVNLSIPAESTSSDTDTYLLVFETTNVVGRNIKAEIRNSHTDDNGEQIQLPKTNIDCNRITIDSFTLKKGYSSQLTLYIYRPANQCPSIDEKYELSVWKDKQPLDNIEQLTEKNEHSQFICKKTFNI